MQVFSELEWNLIQEEFDDLKSEIEQDILEELVYIFCFFILEVFMLSEDIELVGSEMESSKMWSHKREAWVRIKTALVEAQKTPTNSKSMQLCDGCNKPFPELICYCEDCLDHVVRMGA